MYTMKIKIGLLSLLLSGCSMHNYATLTQCKKNAELDGALLVGMAAAPLAVVASVPIALGVGATIGGGYYAAHNASCN